MLFVLLEGGARDSNTGNDGREWPHVAFFFLFFFFFFFARCTPSLEARAKRSIGRQEKDTLRRPYASVVPHPEPDLLICSTASASAVVMWSSSLARPSWKKGWHASTRGNKPPKYLRRSLACDGGGVGGLCDCGLNRRDGRPFFSFFFFFFFRSIITGQRHGSRTRAALIGDRERVSSDMCVDSNPPPRANNMAPGIQRFSPRGGGGESVDGNRPSEG
ncbi:uncharacterized protein LY79DRAFT_64198 [Colletotrichum navitas]|uniref:Uncharacterized protein n=1 Tax=Colletotrichum navitas TaxID=681940 RepID=A0AAD8Q5S4_9PEZI|nr:uncharacterized protein LY79DRAFT_64198 [Colletotrichum navitas]KAK1596408.1 hypothetical protein LY79DRAFT_64198 [Colletotrichum navitas]